jgi:hypothetical protein
VDGNTVSGAAHTANAAGTILTVDTDGDGVADAPAEANDDRKRPDQSDKR